jgi:hypothetical protein
MFNATPWISPSPGFLQRVVIQDQRLARSSPYHITIPSDRINCTESTCNSVRIHPNFEDIFVPPHDWSDSEGVTPNPTWKSEFDPEHDQWQIFTVNNGSTVQIEFADLDDSNSINDSDCHVYGYRYLALQVCLKQRAEPNSIIVGKMP